MKEGTQTKRSLAVDVTKPGLPGIGQLEPHHGDPAAGGRERLSSLPCAQRGAGFSHVILTPTHSSYLQGNNFTSNTKRAVIKALQGSGGTELVPGTVV